LLKGNVSLRKLKSAFHLWKALVHSQIVYALTAGRNLYPYIRLGPQGRGEGVDLTPSVTGKGGIRQKKLPDIESAPDRRTWC